jgi:hypothetical protein
MGASDNGVPKIVVSIGKAMKRQTHASNNYSDSCERLTMTSFPTIFIAWFTQWNPNGLVIKWHLLHLITLVVWGVYIYVQTYIYICMCVFWSNPILSRRNQHLWIYVNSGIAGQISLSSKINHGQSPLHHKISVFPDHNWLYSIPIISLVHPHVRRWNPQVKSHWIPYVPIMPPIFSTCFLICFHYSPHILSIYVPYMFHVNICFPHFPHISPPFPGPTYFSPASVAAPRAAVAAPRIGRRRIGQPVRPSGPGDSFWGL